VVKADGTDDSDPDRRPTVKPLRHRKLRDAGLISTL
jgi:hypothetical protein